MFKNKEQVLAKLKQVVSTAKAKQTKYNKKYDDKTAVFYIERAASFIRSYRPRLDVFSFHSGKAVFNPYTGHGTSYGWYDLSKVIKGKLVLNTYNYSSCTVKHIQKFHSLFDKLGLEYVEIEAPQGLQSLEVAVKHHIRTLAETIVENKYARNKFPESVKTAKAQLTLASRLSGIKVSKADLLAAIDKCEQDRAKRLEIARNTPKLITAAVGDASRSGMHVMQNGYLSSYKKQDLIKQARDKGFKRVYVWTKDEYVKNFSNELQKLINE